MAEENEVWKPIPNFEGLYEASSLGRIKSLARYLKNCDGRVSYIREKILKPSRHHSGYTQISLCRDKEYKLVHHRIIANTFLPFINGKLEVNHKNGIKSDNRIENLEWCTRAENIKHAYKTGLNMRLKGSDNPRSKTYVNTENGIFFYSSSEAHYSCKDLNIPRSTFISMTNGRCTNRTKIVQI